MKLLNLIFSSLCLIALLFIPNVTISATYSWMGTTSDWTDPANWNPSTGYPVNDDNIIIDGGTATPELSSNLSINNFTISNAKSLDLKGYVLTISGQATFNSGTIVTSIPTSGYLIIIDNILASTTIGTSVSTTMQFGDVVNQVDIKVKTANILLKGGITFYGDIELEKTGGSKESWYTGNVFNGNVLLKLSSSVSDIETGVLGTGQDVFNGEVTIVSSAAKYINIGGGASNTTTFNESVVVTALSDGAVYFAENTSGFLNNSNINFNKGVQLNNTGTNYVSFARGNTGSGQTINIAQGYSISTGTFSSGKLYLRKIFHAGSVGENIQLTGTATLELWQNELHAGSVINTNDKITGIMTCSFQGVTNITTASNIEYIKNSSFTGTTTITGGRVKYLDGNTFSGGVTITKKGNPIDSDNNDYWLGNNIFGQSGNTEDIIINCEYGLLQLAHTNGEIFNQPVKFNSIVGANLVSGNIGFTKGINEFNSTVELNSAGTSYIHFGLMSDCILTFNEKVTINCSSSGPVYFAHYSDAEVTFNKGIEINNTGTADVRFANSLTNYPIINIDGRISASFSTGGHLFLRNINQSYNSSLTEEEQSNDIEIEGAGVLTIRDCNLEAGGTFTAYRIANIQSSVFKRKTTITTTGSTLQDTWIGGNTFGDPDYALNPIDTSHKTTFNINNTTMLFMAYTNGDNYYQPVIFNNYSTNFYIRQGVNNFYQTAEFNNYGVQNIVIGHITGEVNFKKHVTLNTTNTGRIFPAYQGTSKVKFDEGVDISSTGDGGTAFGYILENQEITIIGKINVENYTAGYLRLRKIIQSSPVTNEIELTGTGILEILNCAFNSSSNFTAPEISNVRSSTFIGNTTFTKTGTEVYEADFWVGDNTYGSALNMCNTTVVINCNKGILQLGNTYGDTFYSIAIFNTINDGYITLSNGNSEFNCVTTINNNGNRVWLANLNGTVLFKDNLVLNSSGGIGINIGNLSYSSSHVTFKIDKGIKTGVSGITGGNVTLVNVMQSGEASNDIKFSNLANQLQVESCTLSGGFFEAPRFLVYSSVFEDFTTFNKVNNVNNSSSDAFFRGNTFNEYVEIVNNTGSVITICPSSENIESYIGNVKYVLNSTGNIATGYAGTCEYFGNVEYVKGENATGYIFVAHTGINRFRKNIKTNFAFGHGNSNGTNYFIGGGDQIIEYTGSLTTKPSPMYGKLAIDKPSGKLLLQMPITVVFEAIFVKGNIVSSTDNVVTFYNNTSTHSGASDLSFIEGPASKKNSGAFTFPIGKTYYRPISIGSQIYSGAIMTAEYFEGLLPETNQIDETIRDISICEYWSVTRVGQSADVNVTMYWQPGLCTPVNPSSMEIAWFNSTTDKWTSLSSSSLTGDDNTGSITSTIPKTGYFTFGYKTKLILNTSQVNTSEFTIVSGSEPISTILTSGPGGSNSSSSTLASSQNLAPGVYVIHPDLASPGTSIPVDLTIQNGGLNKSLNVRLHINDQSEISKVEAELEGVYKEMSEAYYSLTDHTIIFHKQKPVTGSSYSISTNLNNGILFDHSTISLFEVEVPGFSNVVLDIYDKNNTKVYSISGNQWDGKANLPSSSSEYVAPGVYKFEVIINGSNIYQGQLIFK